MHAEPIIAAFELSCEIPQICLASSLLVEDPSLHQTSRQPAEAVIPDADGLPREAADVISLDWWDFHPTWSWFDFHSTLNTNTQLSSMTYSAGLAGSHRMYLVIAVVCS